MFQEESAEPRTCPCASCFNCCCGSDTCVNSLSEDLCICTSDFEYDDLDEYSTEITVDGQIVKSYLL